MNTFSLKVIASDKVFFDGKCGIIIVPALDGEQAIMSHHEDMVIATKEGEVRFKEKEDDDWTKVVVGVGFVYISHNRVIMLVQNGRRISTGSVRRLPWSVRRNSCVRSRASRSIMYPRHPWREQCCA